MLSEECIVVVGSGPCGAMAARELVRHGMPVVMLESGDSRPDGLLVRLNGRNIYRRALKRNLDGSSHHKPTGDPNTKWWTNHNPGGLSNNWTGAVPRFAPQDFDEGVRLHERYRWPVTYQDLVPYYERTERLLSITAGPSEVPNLPAGRAAYTRDIPADWRKLAQLARENGQGLTTLPLADGPPWMVVRRSTAYNSYACTIQGLLRSPNFRLVTGAHALRLEYSESRRRVTSVIYRNDDDGRERRIEAAAVVVAGGPLSSTRLLFNSTSPDFPEGLGNTHDVLGRYLHDHPKEWWAFDMERAIAAPNPALYLTRLPHETSAPLLATSWTMGFTGSRDKMKSALSGRVSALGVQVFGTTVPNKQWRVEPDDVNRDRFGLPVLNINIEYDEDTTCNVVKARAHLIGMMEEAGYKCALRHVPPQLWPGNAVHYGGTIRMHASPEHGMVDSWNRLYAVPNVVVADASCFTTGPEKNPTLTAMAIAMRAAERLAYDLKTDATADLTAPKTHSIPLEA